MARLGSSVSLSYTPLPYTTILSIYLIVDSDLCVGRWEEGLVKRILSRIRVSSKGILRRIYVSERYFRGSARFAIVYLRH